MKKLGLLIGVAFLLAACDASPGGNKSILPVVHDEAVEHVEHHQEGHDMHAVDEAHTETNDSTSVHNPTESAVEEPQDSTL